MNICLPDSIELRTHDFLGANCVVSGWGQNALEGSLLKKLNEARVPIQNLTFCKEIYQNLTKIRAGHLCAGEIDGSSGTCVVSSQKN